MIVSCTNSAVFGMCKAIFMEDTPKFVVGVIGIIRKDNNILLMRRALTKSTNPGKWEAVAGKVEFKENPNDALLREVKEESGLNVLINERPLATTQVMRGPEPMILLYYLCDYVSGDVTLSKEHDAYKWVDFQEFKTLCSFHELIEIVDGIFIKKVPVEGENQKIKPAVTATASQNIVVADTFDILWKELDFVDLTNTLIVFDVDHTLIRPSSLFVAAADQWRDGLQRISNLIKPENHAKQKFLISKILFKDPTVLVEEKTPSLIRKLQEKNIKVIAITGAGSDTWGCIKNVVQWRLTQLKNFGIDFKYAFPHIETTLKLQCKKLGPILMTSEIPQDPAIFREGVIFSGYYDKGDALEQFLTAVAWTPKRIIFADDFNEYLEGVMTMCKKKNIDFLGIHYYGSQKGLPSVDETVSQFQLQYLIEREEWLSDNEAKALMLTQKMYTSIPTQIR